MTLQEIAKRANVSTATVSRTINRKPTVNPALARRVRRVIEEEGYYPNTHARALASGRSRIFGLMVSEITNHFPEIVQTFIKLGVEHNYEILLSFLDHDARLETAARQMIQRRVDGVALLTFRREDGLIAALTHRNVPVFVVDIDSSGPLLKTPRIDYQRGMRQAVQHLAALGHVRIAYISGPAHLKTAAMRTHAFQECINEIGLEVVPELLIEGDHTIEAGMRGMSALARLPHRPSAVICSNDLMAIGAMREAFDLSLDIPRDLSVIGFDDIRLAQFMIPPLTTVQVSQTAIASMAFRALLDAADPARKGTSPELDVIKTDLVLRSSTALVSRRVRVT